MSRYYFDCETDGLIPELTKVHSLVLIDCDTDEVFSCNDHNANDPPIWPGLQMLAEAEEIIPHNGIKFDIPAIQKVFPWWAPKGKVTDTLVLSRLLCPNLFDEDCEKRKKDAKRVTKRFNMPGKLTGSHGLKAWGYRLGVYKGEFGQDTDWQEWTQEMQDYCVQDVVVTKKLYQHLMAMNPSPASVELEHAFCHIIAKQEQHGFCFNTEAAVELYQSLVKRRLSIARELAEAFPPKRVETVFIPKVNNKKQGYIKGEPFTKVTTVVFNPSSRQMIADRLMAMGWKPGEFTPSGQPKIDETILSRMPYPEAKLLADHFLVEKRIGQIAEGENAWLKLMVNGRIHGSVNTNGAVTGRCTHSNPNLAQVPAVKKNKGGDLLLGEEGGWGVECRALFTVRKGFVLVGADLAGLELRCLAHFMAWYDDGHYAKVLLEGDIHTLNQQAAGLPTRGDAKTFIYAFLYGAGDQKIGSIVLPNGTPEEQATVGKQLKARFLAKTPALKKLREAVADVVKKRGYLIGLDGRKLHVRSAHAALNTLLQSAGALIAKQATIIAYNDLIAMGLVWGKDFAQVAHVHDEVQFEVRKGLEELVGKTIVQAMVKAGEHFEFRCPIDGEYKHGGNWRDTH